MTYATDLPVERLHMYFSLMKSTVSDYWDGILKSKRLETIPCTVALQNGEDYINTYIGQMPCRSSHKAAIKQMYPSFCANFNGRLSSMG